jgi:glucose/arabinose dehydrogenase/PKD repeat protein
MTVPFGRGSGCRWILGVSVALALLALPHTASAAITPPDFADSLVTTISSPTALASTPDGRILIGTQNGQVRLYDGALRATPALDISASVCFNFERGLLGLAVDSAFAANHFIYVFAARRRADGSCVNRVSRFVLNGDVAQPASEVKLLDNMYSDAGGGHAGGDLHFGKDGFLYVSVGDGFCDYAGNSGCGALNDAARDPHVPLGKILRITRDGGIPPDNPYAPTGGRCNQNGSTVQGQQCQETYASGLRNPFRFAFDPNAVGTRFYINDVGNNHWEEIDQGQAGVDYGWNVREGHCATGSFTDCGPPPAGMTNPIFDYPHTGNCDGITGGAFVPDGVWPAPYSGSYLYSDYVCGRIFRLEPAAGGGFNSVDFVSGLGASSAVTMAFAPHGSTQALYYTSYANGGEVRRIVFSGNAVPTARLSANPTSGSAPLEVEFDGGASTDPDTGDTLTYLWDFGDGSPTHETTGPTTTHVYDVGSPQPPPRSYRASLRVRDQAGAVSDPVRVSIDVDNTPPTPVIESPDQALRFRVGQELTLEGTATDPEEGTLPDSALIWEVVRVHNEHTHPFLPQRQGSNGAPDAQLVAPSPEDLVAAATSGLELRLTATDSQGGTRTVTRRLNANTVELTFASSPSGAGMTLEGNSVQAPRTLTSWEGYSFPIETDQRFGLGGQVHEFASWSDGGAAAHTLITPASNTTLLASYVPMTSSYRDVVMGTPGLISYWRLGESTDSVAFDEKGANHGSYSGGVTLGRAGAIAGDLNTAGGFDGFDGEVSASGPGLALAEAGTLEGWFNTDAGVPLRDNSTASAGWILAYTREEDGLIAYRVGGRVFRTGRAADIIRGGWHHLVLTKSGPRTAFYVDGERVHTGNNAPSTPAAMPWRVMRNGTKDTFTSGLADEVAVYDRALTAEEVASHCAASHRLCAPPPAGPAPPVASQGFRLAGTRFRDFFSGPFRTNGRRIFGVARAPGPRSGTFRLNLALRGRTGRRVLARARVALRGGRTRRFSARLSRRGRRLIRRSRRGRVAVTARLQVRFQPAAGAAQAKRFRRRVAVRVRLRRR